MPTDVREASEATHNEWLSQQAAIWPDLVRGGPPERRAFNRGEWHYVNVPHFLTDDARAKLEGRLTVNVATDPPGVFHTVGDIHQPLHATAMFSPRLFPDGDRGGNSIKTRQAGNLHSLWDGFPGRTDTYRGARNRALGDMAEKDLAMLGGEAATVLDASRPLRPIAEKFSTHSGRWKCLAEQLGKSI
jgi:S1/P1 Nuclease